jgi:predicted transcriptional regulator
MENEGIDKLLFELASENRLSILRELKSESLKMQEIARRLNVTATEAFRQLERLSASSLIQRKPDGAFTIAEYGKLILQLTSSLEFISKHKEYFSTHDIMRLPTKFVNRIGELSKADLITDTIESINRGERMFLEAEQFAWGIAEGVVPELMGPAMNEQMQKGVKLKFMIPENRLFADTNPGLAEMFEAKGLSDLPAIIALTEKEAGITFRLLGGKMDYTGFFGKEPIFLDWVKDLFLYYWDKGKQA